MSFKSSDKKIKLIAERTLEIMNAKLMVETAALDSKIEQRANDLDEKIAKNLFLLLGVIDQLRAELKELKKELE